MDITLYEVAVPLESTQIMHVTIAAGSPDQACDLVHDMLTAVSEPRAEGDALKYNWRRGDLAASQVTEFQTAA